MLKLEKIKISKILSAKNLLAKKYILLGLIILVLFLLFFIQAGKCKPKTDSNNQRMKEQNGEDYSTAERFLILDPNYGLELSESEKKATKPTMQITTTNTPRPGLWERIQRDMTKGEVEYNQYSNL
ncbi:uncharacterized protein DMAD_12059 [Drosophila madeirensis]|uniref:Uncharacterized protein n=1 Tax=Drosophila madeirensis TaxID=30013 RepID=A0AAU9FFF9_DROMD